MILVAFILSDQCFLAALPASGEGDCLAIIWVEDATLGDLVSTFMRMSRGCNIAIGSVIIISSLNHLGRVGTAAYDEDLVDVLHNFRQTFSGQIRVVHGFPTTKISDQVTIRALMELKAWLEMADNRRAHSMEVSSKYFVKNILLTGDGAGSSSIASAGIPLRMPASINTIQQRKVGFYWPGLAKIGHIP